MSDAEVVIPDDDIESEESRDRRDQRRRWPLAVLLLLMLLLCCVSTEARDWTRGGSQRAQFIARNAECLSCHSERMPDFNRSVVHNPFALKQCTVCHTPHGRRVSVSILEEPTEVWRRFTSVVEWLPLRLLLSITEGRAGRVSVSAGSVDEGGGTSVQVKGEDSKLVMPLEDLCWMCHGDMGAKISDAYGHNPFMAGRCTNCHDPHASDFEGMISQEPETLCLTCHPIGQELARDQQHSPVAKGYCIDCHDPHASKYKGILVARQQDLCFGCHAGVATKSEMAVQHAPFVNDECTGCHEPHGSDFRPLLVNVQPGLCYGCHPQIENQFAAKSHHPVGVTLDCSSCHDPHAADFDALVTANDNQFCFRCHSEKNVAYTRSSHEPVLCIQCHTPHGSAVEPMLMNENPELCLECHEPAQFDESGSHITRNNHPVRPVHRDVNAQSALTCTSSCHNPHGTGLNFMLRYFTFPDDGACLMCHAAIPGDIVGLDF